MDDRDASTLTARRVVHMLTKVKKQMRRKLLSVASVGIGEYLWRSVLGLVLGLGLTFLILVSTAGFCVVMMPLTVVTRNLNLDPVVVAVYGSLREGRAYIKGGYRVDWHSRLRLFHLETPLTFTGPDSRIDGIMRTNLAGVSVNGLEGRAGPGLMQLVPGALKCEVTARVSRVGFTWTWTKVASDGEITTPSGNCRKEGRNLTAPPLTLRFDADGSDAIAILRSGQAPPMVDLRLRRDRILEISILPSAEAVFPRLPRGGLSTLEIPF